MLGTLRGLKLSILVTPIITDFSDFLTSGIASKAILQAEYLKTLAISINSL